MSRLSEVCSDLWNRRPTIVSKATLTDLRTDLAKSGTPQAEPERSKLHDWLSDRWYHRPIITRFSTFDERYGEGFTRGLDHARTTAVPVPAALTAGHAARTTETGCTLVAVG